MRFCKEGYGNSGIIQQCKYKMVFNKINKNVLLISDGIYSCAFINFYRKLKSNYEMLNFVTDCKVLGIVRRKAIQKSKLCVLNNN